ncbi:lipid II-degrading bacteriocin [Pseudomonas weihenstephanensis]|uniref:lipid II-degrading bacteriocin n=1 Tax=Pseudomonas weihenstephanensis TaxID=1608994 RepID=UPI0012FB69DA|nr:lipid II-degrading bacteriocin [Pseudomonas weihenstephanensis]
MCQQVNKKSSAGWLFNGEICALNDRDDANPSNPRNGVGETLASILGKVMRYDDTIEVPGEIPINRVGQ